MKNHAYKPEWGDGTPCSECMGPPEDHEVRMNVKAPILGSDLPPGKTFFPEETSGPPPRRLISNNPDPNVATPDRPAYGRSGLPTTPLQPYTRDWVMRLPLREQGTLMAGIRGCDTVVDSFLGVKDEYSRVVEYEQVRHPTKAIVAALRYIVGTPHDEREVDTDGAFMARELPDIETWPVKCLDDLPLHFVMHLLHAIEVVAYRLPDKRCDDWFKLYFRICEHMHVYVEPRVRMIQRLSEDRIALGTVKERPQQ